MRLAICDDDTKEQKQLLHIIQDWDPACATECFSDGISLELMPRLGKSFLKINRGIVVNMDYIERMGTDRRVLLDGKDFFLAVRERSAICAAYNDCRFDRLSRRDDIREVRSHEIFSAERR